MLNAVSEIKEDKYCRLSLKCGSKKVKRTETETRMVNARVYEVGEKGNC